ncbi:MAG: hypothetical protein Fur0015_13560 [Ignavibacteriales bacterium]
MKLKIQFLLLFFAATLMLAQQEVGKVTFLLGEVQYSKEGSNQWTKLKINEKIFSDYLLKLIDDAEMEIKWSDGEVTELATAGIKRVADLRKGSESGDWLNKVKSQIKVIVSNKKDAQTKGVAGVRRDEVNISKQDTSLYWENFQEADFNEGYTAFENNDTTKAIKILETYVKQNPSNPNAELAHGCLLIIYNQQNKKDKMKEHLNALKQDFPQSKIIASFEEALK